MNYESIVIKSKFELRQKVMLEKGNLGEASFVNMPHG